MNYPPGLPTAVEETDVEMCCPSCGETWTTFLSSHLGADEVAEPDCAVCGTPGEGEAV